MSFQDKNLTCRDCGKEFVWTSGEQEFFAQKGFDKPPIRCFSCRKKKKDKQAPVASKPTGELFTITCSKCGKKSEVDFKPRNPDGILCSECFEADFNSKK